MLIGLGLIALIMYLALTDFSRYRSDIESVVTEVTGREFRIDGEFSPEFFPLSLVAGEISLANADWGSDTPFLSIGHISVKIDLGSLFFSTTRVREFRLHDVALLLEVNSEGEDNWSMTTEEPDDQVDTGNIRGDAIILDLAEVRNVTVIYRVAGEEDRSTTIASIDAKIDEEGFIEVAGLGQVNSSDLSINASAGPIDQFASGGNVDFNLETSIGETALTISGNTGVSDTLDGSRMEAELTSDDVATVLRLINVSADVSGPLRANANLAPQNGHPVLVVTASVGDLEAASEFSFAGERISFSASVSPLNRVGDIIDVAGLPDAPLSATGELVVEPNSYEISEMLLELQSIQAEVKGAIGRSASTPTALSITISSDNLQQFSSELPAIALTGEVSATITPERIKLDPFEIKFADSDIDGSVDIQLEEPVAVVGQFHSALLDLTPFAAEPEEATDDAAPADSTAEAGSEDREFVFNNDPLPFDFLHTGTVDVQLVVDEFRQGPLRLGDLQASVKLGDGTLNLESGFAVADGGNASAAVTLASTGANADLKVKFDLSDLRLSLSKNSERSAADIPLIDFAADIESSGGSLREIAASANGNVLFTQGKGKIDNSAIGSLSNDIVAQLFGALNPFAEKETYSIWECTVLALDVVDGVAEISPMLAQSDKLTIVADGKIDLNDEHMDIRFNTKPRSGVGVSADMFVTPFIQLGGTLAGPRMELDKKGVIVSGGAAILTGGISFFVKGAADRASGATDRCAAALAIANGQEVELE
jgi:uncharacterized protein involved in outer membrane biogenesis